MALSPRPAFLAALVLAEELAWVWEDTAPLRFVPTDCPECHRERSCECICHERAWEEASSLREFCPDGYIGAVPYMDVILSMYDDSAWFLPEEWEECGREYQNDRSRDLGLSSGEDCVRVFLAPLPPPVECYTEPLRLRLSEAFARL